MFQQQFSDLLTKLHETMQEVSVNPLLDNLHYHENNSLTQKFLL